MFIKVIVAALHVGNRTYPRGSVVEANDRFALDAVKYGQAVPDPGPASEPPPESPSADPNPTPDPTPSPSPAVRRPRGPAANTADRSAVLAAAEKALAGTA